MAVVGAAGTGKSRLVRQATDAARITPAIGRAVPQAAPVPYRPVTEALLAALRGRSVPDDPALRGFEGHLGRLVPLWPAASSVDPSPVLVAEAVGRLLAVLGAEHPTVVVFEDLQWADTETLAVVGHLAEALPGTGASCVVTSRPDDTTTDLLRDLEHSPSAEVVRLEPLDDASVAEMVAGCLATSDLPAGLVAFVEQHAEGNPFLVEELLAGLVSADALVHDDDRWVIAGPLTVGVPASLRDSVNRRLAGFDPTHRRVLGAAALLGRSFSWELLPGVAAVDGATVVAALRAAVDAQLIETDGETFGFRHALSREAVLADVLPPERRDLAQRAWPAIERAHPGLPGPTCELAAELAEAAGEPGAASALLVESARRALSAGALVTAERTSRRARDLADPGSDELLAADEVLVNVLTASGQPLDALAVGRDLTGQLASSGATATRRTDLLIVLARAALAGGDVDAAARAVDDAVNAVRDDGGRAVRARIDAVAAAVAIDRADLTEAQRLARRAVAEGEATDQPEVVTDGHLVLGRAQRPGGADDARRSFERASSVAEVAGLVAAHLRARHELALLDFASGLEGTLRPTRAVAAAYGAHDTVAAMDLALADIALGNFDRVACEAAATACVAASRRYGLASEPVAQLWLAGAHALAGDDEAMYRAIDAARAREPDDPRILGDLYGRVLTTRALVRDELETLPELLDEMMRHVRRAPPTTSIYPGRMLWALLHTVDDVGFAVRAEYRSGTRALGLSALDRWNDVLDAVAFGRQGASEEAMSSLERARTEVEDLPLAQGAWHVGLLLVARVAIRDGWGDPVSWLRRVEGWFAERGIDGPVRRARALLREAGAPVPRRGRGDSVVPASLRELGVTSREVDVLHLVVDGRTTKQIAAALHLSPKTVERHLSNLFDRTGVRNRRDLATLGANHLRG